MKPPICRICEVEHWTWQPHDAKSLARVAGANHAEAAAVNVSRIRGTLHLPKRKGGDSIDAGSARRAELLRGADAVTGAAHPRPRGTVTEIPNKRHATVTENASVTEKKRGRPKGKRSHADRQRDYRKRKHGAPGPA